ncbi:NAD-dependent epimerase/dehydratase family protein [Lacticaseibacillus saniviri]|uniref:NAD-dependent epimerase/dehydratase domain-containing protein n=1 Tax=Lacticaseibacillus saniviri JCM 17471 = DSM 24301 TaxID=1293598 RepID=A0A0R2MUC4_9LACO|nr:NAD-dependent epimerase/dehydratase family protein [Lacticaseibacillus saniviri]KRO15171.1 hypothetical protein IV56_GL000262 [Lacticaseibacillus saniviri JCM 17471 = DSM 24301]MCG4281136.1 NAD-dependent epimerase/dehydratase family protein [Lacticaseibacillus saniviri]
MQTILGSNGQIGQELAKELNRNYTQSLRLVSRHPQKVNETDEVMAADLMNFDQTNAAVAGSAIVYFTVGLPMNSTMWEEQFPTIIDNVIRAVEANHSKLVFFDNTYMYPKDARPQTETTAFEPIGRKATVRAKMAQTILGEMAAGRLDAVICRAPEFYGPGKTQSITNTMLFKNLKAGKKGYVPLSDRTLRSLIWTPDASRAMALIGNTPDAFGQTWHLPVDKPQRYRDLVQLANQETHSHFKDTVLPMWLFRLARPFNQRIQELFELLPRYKYDNLFVTDKFNTRFPDFKTTTFEEGIHQIFSEE